MIRNFSFNSKTHDLWPVYETIKKFYPIGLRRNQGKGLYFNYPGFEEFEEIFKFVEQKIKEKYPNHKIIPFRVGQSIIDGLQVRYLDDENCSLNKALFNQQLSEERIKHYPRGDQLYGLDVWKKN